MTTRELLNRRFWGGLGVLYATVGATTCAYAFPKVAQTTSVLAVGLAFLMIAAAVAYRWRTPCVHCRKPMAWIAVTWITMIDKKTLAWCPHCGVSIDRDASAQG